MALHGAEPRRRTSHGSHQEKPSKEEIGSKLREGFGILGRLAKGDKVIEEAVQPKKKKKKMAAKPPTPRINAGLRKHRMSVEDRALKPSVAGLLRAQ